MAYPRVHKNAAPLKQRSEVRRRRSAWPFSVHKNADLLDRTSALQRVLFTQDEDFLAECAKRQSNSIPFFGLIYAHQMRTTIGQCVHDLELVAKVYQPCDMAGRIEHLRCRKARTLSWRRGLTWQTRLRLRLARKEIPELSSGFWCHSRPAMAENHRGGIAHLPGSQIFVAMECEVARAEGVSQNIHGHGALAAWAASPKAPCRVCRPGAVGPEVFRCGLSQA